MTLTQRLLVAFSKVVTGLIFRIHDEALARVPDEGPLILITNHINIWEIPILFTYLLPRPVTGFVSAHRWENAVLAWLLDTFGAIPLRRGEADLGALRKGMARLEEGALVAIAPEGTRSGHGRLQQAHPGVALFALRSGAPLLPVAWYGNEGYRANLRRLRRTDFHFVVGKPFLVDAGGRRVDRQVRQEMVDAIMFQMAALLPPAYRGVYADIEAAASHYLVF